MNQYSAAASALGYVYQFWVALLLALQDETRSVLIESLDDVEVVREDGGRLLFQLKHVGSEANLTDMSPDLWKTIRVWADQWNDPALRDADFILMTTGSAPTDGVTSLMKDPRPHVATIVERLTDICSRSANDALQPAFESFLALSDAERREFVRRIRVVDRSQDIEDVEEELLKRLAIVVQREHRPQALAMLEGWWLRLAIRHLRDGIPINCGLVFSRVRDIAHSFGPHSLPVTYANTNPPEDVDPHSDARPFVLQLRAIDVNLKRVENAIFDYYRAFEQRAKWVREDLLVEEDLGEYEDRLVEEWDRVRLAIMDELPHDASNEDELKHVGRKILTWMELEADERIREGVTAGFVIRGSYHILANAGPECRVWWHPDFPNRVAGVLGLQAEGVEG